MTRWFKVTVDERTEDDVTRGCPPKLHEVEAEEGEHNKLVNCFARKYTHHPVALVQDLARSKLFRFMPLADLCALVVKHSRIRAPSWEPHYMRNFTHYLARVECAPYETVEALLPYCRLGCLTCDAVTWPGINAGDEPLVRQDWNALLVSSRPFNLAPDFGYTLCVPLFCSVCCRLAKKLSRHVAPGWQHDELRLLTVLNGMLKLSSQPLKKAKRGQKTA